jgi:hypothetical protein
MNTLITSVTLLALAVWAKDQVNVALPLLQMPVELSAD